MGVDYTSVINCAVALQEAGISRQERLEREDCYHAAVAHTSQSIIDENRSTAAIRHAIASDFRELGDASSDEYGDIYDRVRYDILKFVDERVGPTPAQQATQTRLIGIGATLAVVLLAVAYGLVRQYSATPVNAPIESGTGIEQRSAALAKVLRYDSFGSRRGGLFGLVRNLALWPVEPTEAEIASTGEFGGATVGLARDMNSRRLLCAFKSGTDQSFSDDEMEALKHISTVMRQPSVKWLDPPAATIAEALRQRFPCP